MSSFLRRALARRHVAAMVAAGSVLLIPSASSAFCRTTTVAVPASYSPSRGCFSQGLFLYWGNACVGYSINKVASARTSLDEATRVIDAAFATWNASTCKDTGAKVGIAASNLGPVECDEVKYSPTARTRT